MGKVSSLLLLHVSCHEPVLNVQGEESLQCGEDERKLSEHISSPLKVGHIGDIDNLNIIII